MSAAIKGYTEQSDQRLALVNANKEAEESILRTLDHLALDPQWDRRWLAISRTHIEEGFMAMNRAIFQPERVAL